MEVGEAAFVTSHSVTTMLQFFFIVLLLNSLITNGLFLVKANLSIPVDKKIHYNNIISSLLVYNPSNTVQSKLLTGSTVDHYYFIQMYVHLIILTLTKLSELKLTSFKTL